ncbi:hypothetical protein ACSFBF_25240 [Variovorax sp. ZT5P49]|uniref:hypothetical protein n=1 Tax=Variovorax sp. ZT5P49 TaxID=3443733 RepID=UPI003F47B6A2
MVNSRSSLALDAELGVGAPVPKSFDLNEIKLRSGWVSLVDGAVIRVKRDFRLAGGSEYKDFDLREYWIPDAPFGAPIALAERPDLVSVILQVVDNHYLRSVPSKSRETWVGVLVSGISKLFEYGRLNGLYRLEDWVPQHFARLPQLLAREGWAGALKLVERTNQALDTMTLAEVEALVSGERYAGKGVWSLHKSFNALIGTTLRSKELALARLVIARRLVRPGESINPAFVEAERINAVPRSSATLSGSLRVINMLAEIDQGGLKFLPFTSPEALADRVTRIPAQRTGSIAPDELAELLKTAFWWVYTVGPPLIQMLEETLIWHQCNPGNRDLRGAGLAFDAVPSRALLEMELGSKVGIRRGRKSTDIPLVGIVDRYHTAAFIIIAAMNGRRKDEIQHSYIGLHAGALSQVVGCVDVHVCQFYIEKTVRDYVPFFVNQATRDAVAGLKRVSDVARQLARLDGNPAEGPLPQDNTLFCMPFLLPLAGAKLRRFRFAKPPKGGATPGRDFVLSDGSPLKAHMLRRAYALLYHYRYENATLISLAQQLQHRDLEMTRHYVTDAWTTPFGARGVERYGRLTPAHRAAIEDDRRALDEDVRQVGVEKLHAFVASVVDGRATYSGGYSRLVQRFHQNLKLGLHYASLNNATQSKVLADVLVERGQLPLPFGHGTCMAGSSRSSLKGKCYSDQEMGLDRSRASPQTCATCSYHVVTQSHVIQLEHALSNLQGEKNQNASANVLTKRREAEIRVIAKLIELHKIKLGG